MSKCVTEIRADETRRLTIQEPAGELDPWTTLPYDVARGLRLPQKQLPPKYFYDATGSALFEQITRLPEYYQTRSERRILGRCASDIVRRLQPRALVEFGSGSASKTRILLDAMRDQGLLEGYGAIEVSRSALRSSAIGLLDRYPTLRVIGVVGDFEHPVPLPFEDCPRLVLFLGSTIGNLTPEQAHDFLVSVRERLSPADGFLIGFDLVKDPVRLVSAYDDAAGVTARFNLNVLRVLNERLGANFDLARFRHRALYDSDRARIEMHLVSDRDQTVRISDLDMDVVFREGETIRTELSHKYTRDTACALLRAAGLEPTVWETDADETFAVGLATIGGPGMPTDARPARR